MTYLNTTARFLFLTAIGSALFFAPISNAQAETDEEQVVKDIVTQFLTSIGDGDLDALPAMFAANANIGAVSLREGEWVASTSTFEAWFSELKAETSWTRFQEPVSEFAVHIEHNQMAFVRADATFIVEDVARSRNIDYFTLVREDGTWKFLSASYVTTPIDAEQSER